MRLYIILLVKCHHNHLRTTVGSKKQRGVKADNSSIMLQLVNGEQEHFLVRDISDLQREYRGFGGEIGCRFTVLLWPGDDEVHHYS